MVTSLGTSVFCKSSPKNIKKGVLLASGKGGSGAFLQKVSLLAPWGEGGGGGGGPEAQIMSAPRRLAPRQKGFELAEIIWPGL